MHRVIMIVFTLILWLGSSTSSAKLPANPDEIDALIHAKMQEFDIPGLSLVVIKGRQIIKQQSYGLASLEFDVPITEKTVFQIASTTKGFTGVGIMMLVEEGKLSLDDKIVDILPGISPQWDEVTVRQIMTHTSGLPRILDIPGQVTGKEEIPGKSYQDAIEWISQKPNEFKPGEKWVYNQTGYMLASMIIEAKSGKSWEEFAQERFFDPLGMSSTTFGDLRELIRERASIYENHPKGGNRPFHKLIIDHRLFTAAGINTTPGDMAKWLIALQESKLLKQSSLDLLWTPAKLGNGKYFEMPVENLKLKYGIGWFILDFPSGHHTVGGEGGSYNAFLHFPKQELTVVVLTNKVGSNDLFIVIDVAKKIIPALQTGN
ncbi:serine hydrolase domain-containing protein [Acidobacteriota bacterium]